jgi:hypothetical protein
LSLSSPEHSQQEPEASEIKESAETNLGSISNPSQPVKIELLGGKRKGGRLKKEKTEKSLLNGGRREVGREDVHTPEMEGNEDGVANTSRGEEYGDDDWCALCHDGGDTLYCCDRCPKVYHLFCYIPPLTREPPDDWVCLMCAEYDEIQQFSNKPAKEGGLGDRDLKTCRRVLFEMYNQWPQSVAFKDCSDLNFAEYLDVIKKPIALDVIKEKLSPDNPEQVC